MIELSEILTIAFIRICEAQLDRIERRCQHKAWIKIIIDYAENELTDVVVNILVPGIEEMEKNNPSNEHSHKNMLNDKELYALICDLKSHFEPADFLFLKAMFTEDERDRIFYLEQAQRVSPENLRIHLITTFMSANTEEDPDKILTHMNSLIELTQDIDVKEYTRLLGIIRTLSDENSICRPQELAEFLNSSSLPEPARYSLLHRIIEHFDAREGKKVLCHLKISGCEKNWMYQLAHANVCYILKDYKNALNWYNIVIANNRLPQDQFMLEIQYKLSVVLRETGSEGRAILLLREILFSDDYEGSYSDFYLHAIEDLAAYYVRLMQAEEADKVLTKLPLDMLEYMEDFSGEDFLVTMADKAMLEADFEKALHYYKKAFRLNTNPDIGEKIRMLGEDI